MDQTIKIRVSAEDKALFEASAKRLRISLSAWIRAKLSAPEVNSFGVVMSGDKPLAFTTVTPQQPKNQKVTK